METVGTKMVNRAATARPAAAPLVQRATRGPGGAAVRVQTAMRVSSPKDPAEREAESTAKRIMRMPAGQGTVALAGGAAGELPTADEKEKKRPELGRAVLRAIDEKEKKRPGKEKEIRRSLQSPYLARLASRALLVRAPASEVQRKAEGLPDLGANVAAEIQASDAAGQPLPLSVRRFMEPRFRADFGGVRIHTSDRAATLNRHLAARAFTVGRQIFFGRDQFRPETDEGKELIAHELTHTIQQGTVAQRSEDASVSAQAPVQVQRLGISDALDYFADKANNIPGFRMFTILLGVNPINMSRVERSAANVLRAIVEFLPGGHLIVEALDNYGIFDKIGRWVDDQLKSLGISGGMIRKAIDDFLDALRWRDIFHLGRVWDRAKSIITDPISRIISFARRLAGAILTFIKDAILRPLAALAARTRGYDLLKAVLGKDPITGDPVPQTAETLIAGFMRLIGQEDVWRRMQQSKAIPRAWAWFKGALAGLLGFVREIPGLFVAALRSLTISDVVLVAGAFAKVGRVFGGFIFRFISWAGSTVWTLLEIIFDVVSPGALRYIKRTGAALRAILKNPLPFVRNLGKAAKGGFLAFAGNFLTHLKEGLLDWLTGSLPGIYIPKAFTLQEIVRFVLSVLGLTWANIRQKLVKVIGEPAVVVLEKTFDIVVTLVRDGPAAAWEKIKDQLANLKDMVIGGITDMVVDMITKKAIPKLVAMFIPGAGFISAILSIYDMIMVFVHKIAKIIQVVTGFIDSLVAIAAGRIGAAIKRVEGILAALLTLAINFLAGFAGLGKVADKVMGVIQKIRAPIDKALDWLVNFIVTGAKRLFASLFGKDGKADQRTEEQKNADRHAAVLEANALLKNPAMSPAEVEARLPAIRTRFKLASLVVITDAKSAAKGTFHIRGVNSPPEDAEKVEKDSGDWPVKVDDKIKTERTSNRVEKVVSLDKAAIVYTQSDKRGAPPVRVPKEFFMKNWDAGNIVPWAGGMTSEELRAYLTSKWGAKVADAFMNRGALVDQVQTKGKEQAHHVLPIELLERQAILRELVNSGWDYNQQANGIALDAGFHGNHPAYTNYVDREIGAWMSQHPNIPIGDLVDPFATYLNSTLYPRLRRLIGEAKKSGKTLHEYFQGLGG